MTVKHLMFIVLLAIFMSGVCLDIRQSIAIRSVKHRAFGSFEWRWMSLEKRR